MIKNKNKNKNKYPIKIPARILSSNNKMLFIFKDRMRDILDSWLKVQAAWLYLEPIFGSEDIRAQIPVEGKMFEEVHANW